MELSVEPKKTLPSSTSGDESTGPPVLAAQTFLPLAKSNAYASPSPEPMNTRPSTIAADDLTGPPVLKLQSNDNFSGSVSEAMPVRAGFPRNMGQFTPLVGLPSEAGATMDATKIAVATVRNEWV